MRSSLLAGVIAATLTIGLTQAQAGAVLYTSLNDWEAAAGTYTETTNLGVADGTIVNGATLDDGTKLKFAEPLGITSIGTGWATWCCSYAGQIAESYDTGAYTTEHWTISTVNGFGVFLEPDPFSTLDITLETIDGGSGGFITQSVSGDSGADFFGWIGAGVTGMTISSSADFGVGDWFTTGAVPPTGVPEPATLALFGAGLAALGARRRRKGKA